MTLTLTLAFSHWLLALRLGDFVRRINYIFFFHWCNVLRLYLGTEKLKKIRKGFDKDKIIVFNDVREAYPFIGQLAISTDVYALFENDLPDTYNEK